MMKHLAFTKLHHWEPATRKLAGQSMSVIASFQPEVSVKDYLQPLIEKCFSRALHIRHGAILGIGELLIGLSGNSAMNRREALEAAFKSLSLKERKLIQESDHKSKFQEVYEKVQKTNFLKDLLNEDVLENLKSIIPRIDKERLYRGIGGEIMRAGVCHLIYSFALAKLPFTLKEQIQFLQVLIENLKHPNIEI